MSAIGAERQPASRKRGLPLCAHCPPSVRKTVCESLVGPTIGCEAEALSVEKKKIIKELLNRRGGKGKEREGKEKRNVTSSDRR